MSRDVATEIAIAAARLVVDEGMAYGSAKRRAARDLNLSPRNGGLPSNDELEDEVRAHIALFHADTQPAELAVLRKIAIEWMERMVPFRPHLAGAVWRGTATRLSTVHIDLYCDDSKSAELALIDARVDYDAGQVPGGRGGSHGDGNGTDVLTVLVPCRELDVRVQVDFHILDYDDLRGALRGDARGRPQCGDLAGARALAATA